MKRLKLFLAILSVPILTTILVTTTSITPAAAATPVHQGVDFAWHGPLRPAAYKQQGVEFVVRYIAGNRWTKEATKSEVDLWSRAGVKVVLVWETTASRSTQGYWAGYRDASIAYPQAASLGMPYDRPVYFAVDTDTSGPAVRAYFQGVYDWARKHFSDGQASTRIGVYGGYYPVKYIVNAGYARYAWQTVAWMHGRGWIPNALQQHGVNRALDGTMVDFNRVTASDYGQWTSTRVTEPVYVSAKTTK